MARKPGQSFHRQDVLGRYPPPGRYRVVLQADLGGDLGGASSGADDIPDMHTEIVTACDLIVKAGDTGAVAGVGETVGARLLRLRRKQGLRQWQVAKAVGLSRNFISSIETDSGTYSRDTLKRLAAFYQVSIDEIELGGSVGCSRPSIPKNTKIVEDPVKIQLLDFWDSLSPEKQEFFVDLLKSASNDARKLR